MGALERLLNAPPWGVPRMVLGAHVGSTELDEAA